jgi:hypothetical protein
MINHQDGDKVTQTSGQALVMAKRMSCDVRGLERKEPQQGCVTNLMDGWGSPAPGDWRTVDEEVWEWMKEGQANSWKPIEREKGEVSGVPNICGRRNSTLTLLAPLRRRRFFRT